MRVGLNYHLQCSETKKSVPTKYNTYIVQSENMSNGGFCITGNIVINQCLVWSALALGMDKH